MYKKNNVAYPKALAEQTFNKYRYTSLMSLTQENVGRDSAVGIATRYGMEGTGIKSRWGRDFPHLFRPTLGPTQPPLQWVPGLSRG
jgi:hypothetical protein